MTNNRVTRTESLIYKTEKERVSVRQSSSHTESPKLMLIVMPTDSALDEWVKLTYGRLPSYPVNITKTTQPYNIGHDEQLKRSF